MRPLELTFCGFRSYIGRQHIDFRGHNLVGVTGDTGAGKSTILIAINFALFGNCTWETPSPKVLIADGGEGVLAVELIFGARGKEWKVTRQLSNKSTTSVSRLEALDGSETRHGREVTNRIEQLIGLDQRTFIRSVLLPQGKFEQLLHARASERARMLKGLLGLDVLDNVSRQARDRRDALMPMLHQLRERRAALLPDPRATAATAASDLVQAEARIKLLEAAQAELAKIDEQRAAVRAEHGQLTRLLEELNSAAGTDASQRLQALAQLDSDFAAHDTAFAREIEPRRLRRCDLLDALGDHRPGGSLAEVPATALTILGQLRERIDRETEQSIRNAAEAAAITELQHQAAQAGEEADRQQRILISAVDDLAVLKKQRDALAEQVASWRKDLTTIRRTQSQLRDLRDALTKRHAEHAAAELKLQQCRIEVTESEEAETAAVAGLDAHKRLHSAAHAAGNLQSGDPCPVCDRGLPVGFTAPHAPDLRTAELTLKKARSQLKKSNDAAATALGDERSTHIRAEQAALDLTTTTTQSNHMLNALAEHINAIDLSRSDDDILATHLARLESEQADTDAAAHRLEVLRTTAANASAAAKSANDEVERRNSQLGVDNKNLTALRKTISTLSEMVPVSYRPSDLTITTVADQQQKAETDRLRLAEEWKQLAELDSELEDLGRRRTQLAQQRTDQISGPATKSQQEMLIIAASHAAIAALLHTAPAPQIDLAADLSGRAEWAREVARHARHALQDGPVRVKALDQLLQQLDTCAADVIRLAPTDARTIAEALNEAIGHEAIARESQDNATKQIAEADHLDGRILATQPHLDGLNDLVALLSDGKFVAAAVHERQQTLLGNATSLLRDMTLGGYAFGPNFQIFDRHNGVLRDVKTLSGGETFQASLALALAVVEQASSSGGRAESLFLDEGFGSLDQAALSYALDALSTQVTAGRLVVVISHMRAVAQHVPALLRVTKSTTGSSVRWATESELADLADEAYGDGLHE
ncbi:MAG TPA: SMC family ATPase [Candidatus Limnocylindrales bacterium]|nr:SMC family ATPase [Candidatus Limnocylindrales bacterium]